jgi:hypothetical protein
MLAITLGYATRGSQSEPTVLYAGRDASAATAALLNLPDGIVRAEMYKHPQVTRRFFKPAETAAPAIVEEVPADAPPADVPPEKVAPVEEAPEAPLELASDDKPAAPRRKN